MMKNIVLLLTSPFRLVTLQSCIIDHEESLADVIRQIDTTLDNDVVAILVRAL